MSKEFWFLWKNIDHLFCRASETLESDELRLFLLSDSNQIDNNKYLESLENATELIFCNRCRFRNCSSILILKDVYILKTSLIL